MLLSDHENLIICYTGEPYPVWIWTADGSPTEIMEKAYRLAAENGFVNNGQRFNGKYDLAEYMIVDETLGKRYENQRVRAGNDFHAGG